jgi:hypothetical protein
MKPIQATGRATIRLTDKNTGRVTREITAKNTINADYAAEAKNTIFTGSAALSVFLSEYEQPAPENGIIFPMGKFLGYGKYGVASANAYQGTWAASFSQMNAQANGFTQNILVWDFTDEQAVGTIRSLFLYLDTTVVRYPALTVPPGTWYGTSKWCVENKVLDVAAKTATTYSVADLYAKTVAVHTKVNTLTITGLARDVDSGHIFIFDSAVKKLYEFADIDTDLITANILSTYNCAAAYFGKGLIKNGKLFYLSGNTDPANAAAVTPVGTTLNLFRYDIATDATPTLVDTISSAEIGMSQFMTNDPCAFFDDSLVQFNAVTGSLMCCPVLRIVGDTARLGFTGAYSASSTATQIIQRMSPNKQFLVSGSVLNAGSYPINKIPPSAISQLLLPEPIVKDNQHRLSVSYTISIQD